MAIVEDALDCDCGYKPIVFSGPVEKKIRNKEITFQGLGIITEREMAVRRAELATWYWPEKTIAERFWDPEEEDIFIGFKQHIRDPNVQKAWYKRAMFRIEEDFPRLYSLLVEVCGLPRPYPHEPPKSDKDSIKEAESLMAWWNSRDDC